MITLKSESLCYFIVYVVWDAAYYTGVLISP